MDLQFLHGFIHASLGADGLPHQAVVGHVHREIEIHIGLDELIQSGCGNIRGCHNLRDDLGGAQRVYRLTNTAEFLGLQHILDHGNQGIGIADGTILHRARRRGDRHCVHKLVFLS